MAMKCPGQDTRYWGPESVYETTCPKCGGPIEFFKDESSRKCRKCGQKVLNPKMDFGCAVYCKYAGQCLGTDMSPELLAKRSDLLKDRTATEIKKFLGRNFKRIGRMLKVIEYAEKIQKAEGGDPAIVTLAACLSVLAGISANEGDTAEFSEQDELAARDILARAGAPDEVTRRVLSLLLNLQGSKREDDLANFKCVRDAIRIAEGLEALKGGADAPGIEMFLTQTGKKLMEQAVSANI
jgi:DNA-directed RNA polymerase subunit RPC12/RpoP